MFSIYKIIDIAFQEIIAIESDFMVHNKTLDAQNENFIVYGNYS